MQKTMRILHLNENPRYDFIQDFTNNKHFSIKKTTTGVRINLVKSIYILRRNFHSFYIQGCGHFQQVEAPKGTYEHHVVLPKLILCFKQRLLKLRSYSTNSEIQI